MRFVLASPEFPPAHANPDFTPSKIFNDREHLEPAVRYIRSQRHCPAGNFYHVACHSDQTEVIMKSLVDTLGNFNRESGIYPAGIIGFAINRAEFLTQCGSVELKSRLLAEVFPTR